MHRDSKAARRYAKALLAYAIEQNELSAVAADMKYIEAVCKENKELVGILKSPVIKTAKKVSVLKSVFSGEIGSISLKFIDLVAKKRREKILPEIAHAFTNTYRDHQGIVSAEIVTAVPLEGSTREKIITMVQKLGDNVELEEKVNENIIGGFIIRVGDKQYDESIASRIGAMKRAFSKNPYISEL